MRRVSLPFLVLNEEQETKMIRGSHDFVPVNYLDKNFELNLVGEEI